MTKFLLALLALSFGANAQLSKVYLDSTMTETEADKHSFYRTFAPDPSKPEAFLANTYYKSGRLLEKGRSISNEKLMYHGIVQEFWENGSKKSEKQFELGDPTGGIQTWYENGKPHSLGYVIQKMIEVEGHKLIVSRALISQFWNEAGEQTVINGDGRYSDRQQWLHEEGQVKNEVRTGKWVGEDFRRGITFEETYDSEGELISGESKEKSSGKSYQYTSLFNPPTYKEKTSDFFHFVSKNFKTPETTKGGRLLISYEVTAEGRIGQIKIVNGIDRETDEAARKMLRKSGLWTPAKSRGKNVRIVLNLPIAVKATQHY
ncbi:energy transducer TonB [Flavobacterium selenitireducens]|uniref:energy transducer TonB n=1 Tax=Flavobacterium selenitireducens TaxID=2722704 RepID=UPI00168BD429|nr:energy transducer TonB [Flavobacterium selenitireducens]MBD3583170.1 hypothetical protein [Flavobacterium selenitireducens]